jgi:tRNA threonylcarbamoyladenosine biosynthesis protein TsaE
MNSFSITTESREQTESLAKKLALGIKGGEIIFLSGPIGAGKTVMVSALAAAFGFKRRLVSASFGIMKTYRNKKIVICHADFFRMSETEMFNLGFEEMLGEENALILAEWPQAAKRFFPPERLEIDFELLGGAKRKINFTARGKRPQELLSRLMKSVAEQS